MSTSPIICFGQQPCGFFPKRFLFAKIITARRLRTEIGGEIVFFYHDSDHDPRETRTTLHHRQSHQPVLLNFEFENKLQRKFSPLYLKRIPREWHRKTAQAMPNYVDRPLVEMFQQTAAGNVADFCLDMYRRMGLLDGIRIARSSDPAFRRAACAISDFFVDVSYEGEIVRARHGDDGGLSLHAGGDVSIALPPTSFTREQISPTRDSRLSWMQSVLHCTHYVSGAGEQAYLNKAEAPEITFIHRDTIEGADDAYTNVLTS